MFCKKWVQFIVTPRKEESFFKKAAGVNFITLKLYRPLFILSALASLAPLARTVKNLSVILTKEEFQR